LTLIDFKIIFYSINLKQRQEIKDYLILSIEIRSLLINKFILSKQKENFIMDSNSDSISDSSFRPCIFLRGADLTDQDLSKFYFGHADFSYAKLIRTNFNKANLRGADLRFADLKGASFLGTNLTKIKLNSTDFRGCLYDDETIFDEDFDPHVAGLIKLTPVYQNVTIIKRQLVTV
jgi:hypothetical protein